MPLPPFANGFQPWLRNNSDTLLAAGAGLLSGQTPQEQAAGLAQGVAGVRQRNKTIDFLRQQNPELAAAVESGALSGGDAYKLFYQQKLEAEKPKNNFLPAGGSLYNTDTGQWLTPPANPAADQETFYGNPIPIQTPNGIQYGQIGSKGSFKPINIGEGNTFAPAVKTVDTGTSTALIGPGGVQVAAPIQKDVAGAARESKLGGAQGDALASIPAAQMTANEISAQIQSLKNDPYLSSTVGPIAGRTPNMSADSQRVQGKIAQLQGGAFLAARQLLKGGGQITDYEGQKAEQAIARMNQAQSPDDFKAALDDFNTAVQTGVKKLQAAAAGGTIAPAPAAAPPPNGTVDYRDYFGN